MRLNADKLGLSTRKGEYCRRISDPPQPPRLNDDSDPGIRCERKACALCLCIGTVYRDDEFEPHTSLLENGLQRFGHERGATPCRNPYSNQRCGHDADLNKIRSAQIFANCGPMVSLPGSIE